MSMLEDIRRTFDARLRDNKWLDSKTVEYARHKLSEMKFYAGRPSLWDDSYLVKPNKYGEGKIAGIDWALYPDEGYLDYVFVDESWNANSIYSFNAPCFKQYYIHSFMSDIFSHDIYTLEDALHINPEKFGWQIQVNIERFSTSIII